MHVSRALPFAWALVYSLASASAASAQVTFTGPELLGRPTADSITINVVANAAIDGYVQYGMESGTYTAQTATQSAAANVPLVAVLSGLHSNTRYYYRFVYRPSGASTWTTRDEHTFSTQRPAGSTFTFTIASDSHVNIVFGNANLYRQTLQNVAADRPDFHIDLGDTFAMDNVTTQAQADSAYLSGRSYFGLMSHSSPVFLALGNHEEEEAWHLDDTGNMLTSKPVMGANARRRYYLNPDPLLDPFYSGNADASWPMDGDHVPQDYYAWQWGDALFVVIDPFWYTTTKPFTGNNGGGESSDPGSGDRWDWTLGWTQYQWLTQTLQNSTAKYKFLFAHHGTGGTDDYIRGGANAVPYVEWGGYNEDGTTWGFDTHRPGWPLPVHQLLVQNHVTAFFHGHDHEYAYEKRDGVVYQEVPMAADANYSYGSFQLYHETDPYTLRVLPNSGHLRVTVSPSGVTVDYVRSYLSGAGTNGRVEYSYTMGGTQTSDTTPPVISAVTAAPGSTSATISWTTDEAADSRVDFGTTTALGSTTSAAALVTAHSVTLTNLTAGTTYYYKVTSKDAATNSSSSPATPASFATTPSSGPLAISALAATPGSNGTATITWTTNVPADSHAAYGPTAARVLDHVLSNASLVTAHSIVVSGLSAGTTYYYQVGSIDAGGTTVSAPPAPASFTMPGGGGGGGGGTTLTITNVVATPQSGGVTITWTTSVAADSHVGYGPSAAQVLNTVIGTAPLVTSHSMVITGLTPGATYYFLVGSIDAGGHSTSAPSQPASFTVPPM